MKRSLLAAVALLGVLTLLAVSIYGRGNGVITLYREDPGFEAEWHLGAVPPDRWIGFVLDEAGWEELRELAGGRLGKVEPPDFGRQVALVAYMGERPTGGYRIHIRELVADERFGAGGELRVRLVVDSPGPSEFVTQAFTYPLDVVILERGAWPERLLERLEAGSLPGEALDQDGRNWGPVRVARPARQP